MVRAYSSTFAVPSRGRVVSCSTALGNLNLVSLTDYCISLRHLSTHPSTANDALATFVPLPPLDCCFLNDVVVRWATQCESQARGGRRPAWSSSAVATVALGSPIFVRVLYPVLIFCTSTSAVDCTIHTASSAHRQRSTSSTTLAGSDLISCCCTSVVCFLVPVLPTSLLPRPLVLPSRSCCHSSLFLRQQ